MPLTLDLALQGGGSRGIALAAAIIEILRRGHGIRRLVGTSAGAIVAAVVAAGFSVDELRRMTVVGAQDDLSLLSECVTEPLVPMAPEVEPTLSRNSADGSEAAHRARAPSALCIRGVGVFRPRRFHLGRGLRRVAHARARTQAERAVANYARRAPCI